ncbi:hypothetical protein [Haloferula sp. BvORR071]|uniref:hypothetical protein n=1 Tax=Haloferula sp. BvORR071 TaxID=1396141 RepID=UPI00055509FB|nr:hypothetical protein [Haloferula sp. BvORR071]
MWDRPTSNGLFRPRQVAGSSFNNVVAEGNREAPVRNRKFRRNGLVLSLGALLAAAAAGYIALRHQDVYHKKERREAKTEIISAVTADLGAKNPPPEPADDDWMNDKVIFCADGSWLAYRSRCHKQDPKVWDIFIAKASDGKWYYSTYHFCVGALVLAMDGQPESLAQFKEKYFLAEFDGQSDLALEKTWPQK